MQFVQWLIVPALSIVSEFHAKGPVTDTLLPHSGVSLVFTGIACSIPGVTEKLEAQVFGAFMRFVRTGVPAQTELPEWLPVTEESEPTMIFDRECRLCCNYDDELLAQFTRWYQIVPRGGFNNIYASFPSGHSMNSAGVILLLLPPMIPALRGRERALHTFVYIWCALVGISRVFMGAHFSSDVTVGVLLSLAIFEALRAALCRNAPKDAALT